MKCIIFERPISILLAKMSSLALTRHQHAFLRKSDYICNILKIADIYFDLGQYECLITRQFLHC